MLDRTNINDSFVAAILNTKASFMIVMPANDWPRLKFELTFPVAQRSVANLMQEFFGCGSIVQRKPRYWRERVWSGSLTYTISKRDSLRLLVDFCDGIELFDEVKESFGEFRQVLELIETGLHLTPEGYQSALKIYRDKAERIAAKG